MSSSSSSSSIFNPQDWQLLLSTTGTQSPVVIEDLGDISFTHPTTDYDLLSDFGPQQIAYSDDLQNAINNGYITINNKLNYPIYYLKNMPLFNANSIVNVPVSDTNINHGRVLVYNNDTYRLEYKNNSGRGVPTFSGSFFNSSTPYLEYNQSGWAVVMYFPFEGSGVITLSKISFILSTTTVTTTGNVQLYDEDNLNSIAQVTGFSSLVDEEPRIFETTTFTNIPFNQAVFSIRIQKTGGTGKLRIHAVMVY